MPQPVPHILIGEYVIVGKGDLMFFHDFEQGFCKAAFRRIGSSLNEHNYLRFTQNALDLGVPDGLFLLKVLAESYDLLVEAIKNHSNIFCLQSLYHLFISLRKYSGGSFTHVVFFERLWTCLQSNKVIFHVFMISEQRNGALKVVLELDRRGIGLRVEGEDKEGAEIVEVGPHKHLIRLERLNP